MFRQTSAGLAAVLILGGAAQAGEGLFGWIEGEWSLTLGASGFVAPRYESGKDHIFRATPIISLGKAGPAARFVSRNDAISLSLVDTGGFRAGVAGKLIFGRDGDDAAELQGLDPIRFGGELGGFAEVYPTDFLRMRAELRHGIRSHDGIVADLSADLFHDVTPDVRVSGGPRATFASADYFDAYYGVTPAESVASGGLSVYDPGGGLKSAGIGGAVTWKATDTITASLFGEYSRLMGPAADSSLTRERGSRNQLLLGVSTTYRFDFRM